MDSNTHHVCLTLEPSGEFKVYVNGSLAYTKVISVKGFRAGGTWVIGQDQDVEGGGFQPRDAFVGKLADVNIWSRVLGQDEIEKFASSCGHVMKGNYKTFSDFEFKGDVEKFEPKCVAGKFEF